MVVYADIVFVINFLMDLFIFWITSLFIKKKTPLKRIALGAFVSAAMYCVFIFIAPALFRNFFGSIAVLSGGLFAAFRPKKPRVFFEAALFAHISAFLVAGLIYALRYLFYSPGFWERGFSFKVLIISAAAFYILFKYGLGWINANVINKKCCCTVKIFLGGKETTATALIDTGNSLKDPLSDSPVTVVELGRLFEVLPREVSALFAEEVSPTEILEALENSPLRKKIRLIPFSSLGAASGMLLGFLADKAEIYREGHECLVVKDMIIGVYARRISRATGCNALISPDIFI